METIESNYLGNVVVNSAGEIVSAPTHDTVQLNSSGDKASKAFLTIASDSDGELYAQWMVEELRWDDLHDAASEFTDVTSISTDLSSSVRYYDILDTLDSPIAGYKVECLSSLTFDLDFRLTIEGGYVYARDYSNDPYLQIWDGNGFGSSGKFNQLTNGTDIDMNNNVIRTVVASTPLNLLKEI